MSVEKLVAQLAVRRACVLAQAVAGQVDAITKSDDSPVTVADFGAQAIIIDAIRKAFPNDKVVGEEEADKLAKDSALREKVYKLVDVASKQTEFASEKIGRIGSAEEMVDAIGHGNYSGGSQGRFWALDPIDGTKGFLRGGQYAVCLALIENAKVVMGVIGCPNLNGGELYSAVRGEGATVMPITHAGTKDANEQSIHFRNITVSDLSDATFCESVEAGHSSHGTNARIAQELGITKPSVRMDSQAKYCSISKGNGDIYLRLPVSATYQEKIWDHAAGNVIVSEAGGVVSDMYGKELDFGVGRTLANNKGVIAAAKGIHSTVLEAVKKAVEAEQ
uniref:3'(2'),5'-bisphosphate nucleotidase n=1 Tax=Blastobotrys adeninivorans TaxID=409370 RepID=A0A060T3N4_BLAAD